MSERMFPIQFRDTPGAPSAIPWRLLDDGWAQSNHDQGLQRLSERGGLSACEALAVIERRRWRPMPDAGHVLAALVKADEIGPLLADRDRLRERLKLVHAYVLAEWRANRLSGPMGDRLIDSLNEPVS